MIRISLVLKKAKLGLLICLCTGIWLTFGEILPDETIPDHAAPSRQTMETEKAVENIPEEKSSVEKLTVAEKPVFINPPSQTSVVPENSVNDTINSTSNTAVSNDTQPSLTIDEPQPISPDDNLLRTEVRVNVSQDINMVGELGEKFFNGTANITEEAQTEGISLILPEENITLIHETEKVQDGVVKSPVEEAVPPVDDDSLQLEIPPEMLSSVDSLPPLKEDSPLMKSSIEPVEDMPSFDEWKKKMLAEQEKSKHNDQISHNIAPPPSKIKQQSKNRNNYASIDCGAKILAINSEAQSASSILIENRDEYMLNPCKAKIWFIVELCEPIQLKLFEIANFELFSSTPQTFRAYSSDRYPTREWTLVGNFNARDERAIQQFPLNEQNFVKYFKIEMLSHFGSEHYCPLSLLRVYGTSMVEEYEDSQSDHQAPDTYIDDLDVDLEKDTNEVPKNLFGSAKDAVLSIVKKAASALTGEKQDGTLKRNETSNLTVEESEKNHISEEFNEKSQSVCEQSSNLESTLYYPHTTRAAIPTCHPGTGSQTDDKNLSVTSSLRNMMNKSTRSLLDDCPLCEPVQNITENHTVYDLWSTCTYMKTLLSVTLNISNCCPSGKSYPRQRYPMDSVCSARTTESLCSFDVLSTVMPSYDHSSAIHDSVFVQYMTSSSINEKVVVSTKAFENSCEENKSCEESLSISAISVQGNHPDPNTIQPTATLKEVVKEVDTKEGMKQLDVEETSSEAFEEVVVGTVEEHLTNVETVNTILVTDTISSASVSSEKELPDEMALLRELEVQQANRNGSLSNINTSLQYETQQIDTTSEGDMLSISALAGGDTQTNFGQGTPAFISPGQKESVFMRLNNRIKALELNMSLSGQYLEELSRRYRKQMEEMQRAFNKTIGALNETAKKAHVMDLKQQEVIAILEAQIENLTSAVNTLTREQQGLHRQVMERHLVLMMIEIIAMVTLVIYCLWYNVPFNRIYKVGKSSQTSQNAKSRKGVKRRSSSDGTIGHNNPENTYLKRRMSEDSFTEGAKELLIVKPSIPILIEVPAKGTDGKRKKNRNKVRHKAKSATNLQENVTSNLDNGTKMGSAGLLFQGSHLENSSATSTSLDHSPILSYNWPLSKSSSTLSSKSFYNSSHGSISSCSSSKSTSGSSLDCRDSGSKTKSIKSALNGSCNGHAVVMAQSRTEKK